MFLGLSVGCSSLQSIPGKMKAMVNRQPDSADPLAAVTSGSNVSDDFKIAKKELKSADDTLLKYAQLREDMGDHSTALDRYRELLTDNPDNVNARLGIARIEYKTGRVHEAEEILKATARLHPQNQQVWIDMGRIQSERQQYDASIESLQKAVAIDSSSQVARFELGLAMARGDRLDEAKSHLSFAVGNSGALYNIGYVLHEAGRDSEAMHWFRQALDSFPDARTKKSTSEMIALINQGNLGDGTRLAEARTIPSKVDVKQTSYEEWRESPKVDGGFTKSNEKKSLAVPAANVPAANVSQPSSPPLLQTQSVLPARQMQPALKRVVHASSPDADSPSWGGVRSSSVSPVPVISPNSPPITPKSVDPTYPPQWKRSEGGQR